LQLSGQNFSKLAARVRENQQLQKLYFYSGVSTLVVALILMIVLWSQPTKLLISLAVLVTVVISVFFYVRYSRESAIKLSQSAGYSNFEAGAILTSEIV
jgi:ABC-type bacteriocin/lantibiotic exporter with double-glycine peptidase domain